MRPPFKYALVGVSTFAIAKIILLKTDLQDHPTWDNLVTFGNLLLLMAAVFMGLLESKRNNPEPTKGFLDFRIAMQGVIWFTLLTSIFSFLYYSHIDPDYLQNKINHSVNLAQVEAIKRTNISINEMPELQNHVKREMNNWTRTDSDADQPMVFYRDSSVVKATTASEFKSDSAFLMVKTIGADTFFKVKHLNFDETGVLNYSQTGPGNQVSYNSPGDKFEAEILLTEKFLFAQKSAAESVFSAFNHSAFIMMGFLLLGVIYGIASTFVIRKFMRPFWEGSTR